MKTLVIHLIVFPCFMALIVSLSLFSAHVVGYMLPLPPTGNKGMDLSNLKDSIHILFYIFVIFFSCATQKIPGFPKTEWFQKAFRGSAFLLPCIIALVFYFLIASSLTHSILHICGYKYTILCRLQEYPLCLYGQ